MWNISWSRSQSLGVVPLLPRCSARKDDCDQNGPTLTGFAEIVGDYFPILHARRAVSAALRRKKNLACVRIFYFGSSRKTADIDVTGVS